MPTNNASVKLLPGQLRETELTVFFRPSLKEVTDVWTVFLALHPKMFIREVAVEYREQGQVKQGIWYCLAIPVTQEERQQIVDRVAELEERWHSESVVYPVESVKYANVG
jgi:hypothetical protein